MGTIAADRQVAIERYVVLETAEWLLADLFGGGGGDGPWFGEVADTFPGGQAATELLVEAEEAVYRELWPALVDEEPPDFLRAEARSHLTQAAVLLRLADNSEQLRLRAAEQIVFARHLIGRAGSDSV